MPAKEIDEIIDYLQSEKAKALSPDLKQLKGGTKLKEIDQLALLKTEQSEDKIKTGSLIDDMIGGGLPPSTENSVVSMLLFGGFGSGKTQTCFTMCVECDTDVIFIDLEGSYRAERIVEICEARGKDPVEVLKRIHLFRPSNWVQQMMVSRSLPSPVDTVTGKIGLIIVDSVSKEFRGIEFAGRENLQTKQPLLREFLWQIDNVAKEFGSAIIFTSQVYEKPVANPFLPAWTGFVPIGGSSLLHQPAFIVMFRRVIGQNVRVARMMDSSWKPLREVPFVITDKGVEDLPENAEARKKLLEKAEKFNAKQQQELIEAADEPLCASCKNLNIKTNMCSALDKEIKRQRKKCEHYISLSGKTNPEDLVEDPEDSETDE